MRHLRNSTLPLLCAFLACAPLSAVHADDKHSSGEGRSHLPVYAADMRGLRVQVEKVAPEALVESLPGGFVAVFLPDASAATAAQDSRYNISCTRAAYVYAPRRQTTVTRTDDGVGLAVVVHYNENDALPARRAARLAARLLRLHRERIGHEAVFPRAAETADVWLAPPAEDDPNRAGETRTNQVYLWGWGKSANTLESVRTLSHEWGHLTLPAARGYTSPENDAAGYLGERLYLKWLRDEVQAAAHDGTMHTDTVIAVPDDGTDATGLDLYYQRQIEPLINQFLASGPDATLMNGKDTQAMDRYIGAALSIDRSFGSRLLGMALYGIDGTQPQDFLRSLQEVIARSQNTLVRLPAWLPLTQGTYTVIGDTTGEVSVSGRPLSVRSGAYQPLPVKASGWKKIICPLGIVRSVTIRHNVTAE